MKKIKIVSIKANELRIGNKIQDCNGFIFDVVSIFKDGTIYCDFKDNEGDVWEFDKNNHCYGILLTEEILLKCGFEFSHFHGDERVFTNEYFILHVNTYDNNIVKFGGVNLKSLHQLQNLYFALTQQELNIEL